MDQICEFLTNLTDKSFSNILCVASGADFCGIWTERSIKSLIHPCTTQNYTYLGEDIRTFSCNSPTCALRKTTNPCYIQTIPVILSAVELRRTSEANLMHLIRKFILIYIREILTSVELFCMDVIFFTKSAYVTQTFLYFS